MNQPRTRRLVPSLIGLLAMALGLFAPFAPPAPVNAARVITAHTPNPTSVAIAGDLQSELGCPSDWQPECAVTELAYDASDDLWRAIFGIPAGNWQYKAALNDTWAENYGAGGVFDGPNIPLDMAAAGDVEFFYDHDSDWDPGCLRSWLQDPDGDGVYTFVTTDIPAGSFEAKVAHNESWDENYGAGGVFDGPNIPFTVGPNQIVTFTYDLATHVLTITAESVLEPGDELLVRPVIQHNFQDQVLYFLMPDRFDDGDDANDCGGLTPTCVENDPGQCPHPWLLAQ
jgi:hypothetical protein